jgi:polysaccharide export outer membrane protein
MPGRRRGAWRIIVWAGCQLCLAGLGCDDALTHSMLGGPDGPSRQTALAPREPGPTQARAASPAERPPGSLYVCSEDSDEDAPPPRRVPAMPDRLPAAVAPSSPPPPDPHTYDRRPPHELMKITHPPYTIEPPDILLITANRLIPRAPYTVQPLDVLIVRAPDALPNEPIDGLYTITPAGYLTLGFSYRSLRVAGYSLERVAQLVKEELISQGVKPEKARVQVGLAQFRGVQAITGEHLVRQDGTISLGTYGCMNVTGLTLAQAKCALERYLSQFLQDPEIIVDVFAYNSKVYYVIADGGGYGQSVLRFPITGNETVLDAISNINGLPAQASRKHIWVARPAPSDRDCLQVLPVDWKAITEGGATGTNYQLFPGDRIYVKADPLITLDNTLAKVLSPLERVLGVALLTGSTIQSFRNNNNFNGNGTTAVVAVR